MVELLHSDLSQLRSSKAYKYSAQAFLSHLGGPTLCVPIVPVIGRLSLPRYTAL